MQEDDGPKCFHPLPCSSLSAMTSEVGLGGVQGICHDPRHRMIVRVGTLTRKGFAPGYKEENQDSLFALREQV